MYIDKIVRINLIAF